MGAGCTYRSSVTDEGDFSGCSFLGRHHACLLPALLLCQSGCKAPGSSLSATVSACTSNLSPVVASRSMHAVCTQTCTAVVRAAVGTSRSSGLCFMPAILPPGTSPGPGRESPLPESGVRFAIHPATGQLIMRETAPADSEPFGASVGRKPSRHDTFLLKVGTRGPALLQLQPGRSPVLQGMLPAS